MVVWVLLFTLLNHLSVKPKGAKGDLLFGLNCRGVLCSHTHGSKHNYRRHGLRFENEKRRGAYNEAKVRLWKTFIRSFFKCDMLCCSQNCITEVFGRAWPPEWEVNVTIMFPGKWDFIEQLYSGSSPLSDGVANQKQPVRAGISVTVFSQGKETHTRIREKVKMFRFKSNIAGFPV